MNLLQGKPLRILVLFHSLSGETNSIVQEICEGLKDGFENERKIPVHFVRQPIQTSPSFPFPWKSLFSFFDCMPETVDEKVRDKHLKHARVVNPPHPELNTTTDEAFDLVILGWQTWFLSPSLPVSLALSNPSYGRILSNNIPLFLVGTHRNMWHRASRTLHKALHATRIVGQADFVQPSTFLRSVTGTLRWQLQGEKPPVGGATQSQAAARSAGRAFALQHDTTVAPATLHRSTSRRPPLFQAGAPYRPLLAWMESAFFPIKLAFARAMGLFPPGSLGRKIVTVLYIPFLLASIVLLAAPTLAMGAIIGRSKSTPNDNLGSSQSSPGASQANTRAKTS